MADTNREDQDKTKIGWKDPDKRIPAHPPTPQGFASEEPQRFILMTPFMAGIGGLIAFFSVVLMVVVLPTATYNPPASHNWLPLSQEAHLGRGIFIANGCVYCHSGFTRPQDVLMGNTTFTRVFLSQGTSTVRIRVLIYWEQSGPDQTSHRREATTRMTGSKPTTLTHAAPCRFRLCRALTF